jgi:hypothetical protein
MTRRRTSKRIAGIGRRLGWIVVGALTLAGAGRREPARQAGAGSSVGAPAGEILPGIARADVDTLDLQLD